jgi:hypothetical protein
MEAAGLSEAILRPAGLRVRWDMTLRLQ